MNILTEKIGRLYPAMLVASLGSALIASVYSIVDMAMIGQALGPSGPAALAVVAPIWNIIYSLGLLTGIGGSVLFSSLRGQHPDRPEIANEMFTVSLAGALGLSVFCWMGLIFFDVPLLQAFGADPAMLEMAQSYLLPVKFAVPCFLLNQFLAAYLRCDGSASLAAWAVLGGGVFNILGDWFFIFPCGMGMMGAGLATAGGAVITTLLMLAHFKMKKNTLHLRRITHFFRKLKAVIISGFSTFFSDIAMGFLTILFNRQILLYLNQDALAVYAIIINISTIVQCFGYSVGQASQPIVSAAYGAGKTERIRKCLHYAVFSALVFGVAWMFAASRYQELFVMLFMKPTASILQMAPAILTVYALSFILLPYNIFASYYCQAIMKPGSAFIISLLRGAVLSGLLIIILPAWISPDTLWWAMPITELLVSLVSTAMLVKYTRELPKNNLASASQEQ